LKKDNHCDEYNFTHISKTEEHEDYGHENNLGDRMPEIDERGEKAVKALIASEKKAYWHSQNKSKKQTSKDAVETQSHVAPKRGLVKLQNALPKDNKGVWKQITAKKQGKYIPEPINKDDGDKVCDEELSLLQSNPSRRFLSLVLSSKKPGLVR